MIYYEVDNNLNTEYVGLDGSNTYTSILDHEAHLNISDEISDEDHCDIDLPSRDVPETERGFSPLGEHLNALFAIDWEFIESSVVTNIEKTFFEGNRKWDFQKELSGLFLSKGILGPQGLLEVIFCSEEFKPLYLLSHSEPRDVTVRRSLIRFKNGIADILDRIYYLRSNISLFNQNPTLFQTAARLTFGVDMHPPESTAYDRDAYALLAIACRTAEDATPNTAQSDTTRNLRGLNKTLSKAVAHNQAGPDKVREMRSLLFAWLNEFSDTLVDRKKILGLLKYSLRIVPPNKKELDALGYGIEGSAIAFNVEGIKENSDTLSIMHEMTRYQVGFSGVYDSLADLITASAAKCYESGKKIKICQICERLFVTNASNAVVCDRPYWKQGETTKTSDATCRQLNISQKRGRGIKQGDIEQEYVPRSKAKLKSDYSQRFKRRAERAAKQAKAGDIKYLAVLKHFFDYIVDESQHYWDDPNFTSGIIEQWLSESCSVLTPSSVEKIYGDGTDCRMPVKSLINDGDSGKQTIAIHEEELRFQVTKPEIAQLKKANENNVKKWWSGF